MHVPSNIAAITPYPPGKTQAELEREYGISGSIKLASNENAWGPSPKVVRALRSALTNIHRYPDSSSHDLVLGLAKKLGVDTGEIVLGNGSNEVIEFLVKAFVREGDEVISSHPSFLMYQTFVQIRGGENFIVPLVNMGHDLQVIQEMVSERTKLIFLDNPNNPTGACIKPLNLYTFLSKLPETVIVVLDEAYVDFMDKDQQLDVFSLIRNTKGRCPLVSLRTFSKVYGLPGLRIGYGLMHRDVAGCLNKVRQPFNINHMAQVGALAALEDNEYYEYIVNVTLKGRGYLRTEVEGLGCRVYPSQANFLLIQIPGEGQVLYEALLRRGVIVRPMGAYGISDCIRVTVGTEGENTRFLEEFSRCLQDLGYV